jgi:gas vesicle structural protein
MTPEQEPAAAQEIALIELVDRVLNKGVVLSGDIVLSVAGVDLVYVGLRVLLASVETLERLEEPDGQRALAGVGG